MNGIKTIRWVDFQTVSDLVKWINNNRFNKHNFKIHPIKIIYIDFSKSKFLKPYHITPLACLIKEYQDHNFIIKLKDIPDKIYNYLNSFKFMEFCSLQQENNQFYTLQDPKILPLWRIEKEGINTYPNFAQQYFENNQLYGKSLFSLGNSLAELMNNIFDHSESKIPGFTFTQYNLSKNEIITCVCDFGIGIPKKINNYFKQINQPTVDNLIALEMAFKKNFSTKSKPYNRGFGWDTIFSNIVNLKSKLLIVTNNIVYTYYDYLTIKNSYLSNYFPWTLIVIYLNTENLETKEEEITDELTII